jgi:mycofactocin system FadH/OYE family oxidoreductase 2
MPDLSHLFSPLQIGPFTVRNRIFMPAHITYLAEGGMPTDAHVAYYAERAKGGAGLIVQESGQIMPAATLGPRAIRGWDPAVVPHARRITEAVHAHGARIVWQILHSGRQMSGMWSREYLWAPSPIRSANGREVPHAMTRDDIKTAVRAYAQTARHARAAGYDGVEIHSAHGYLPQQFMSPLANARTDEYGGSLDNRLRFVREVIAACREALGPDLILGIRISGDEFVEGGLSIDEMDDIAPLLEATGALDYLNVSHCVYNGLSQATMIPDMSWPKTAFVYLAERIKASVKSIPVFTVGRIIDPIQADEIVAQGRADMVGMVRALIADPELPAKAKAGQIDEIRTCIGCNQGCVGRVHAGFSIGCLINPVAGREWEWAELPPAERKKRVMVVGGGPAGMEAARVAALRGHDVTLYEKGPALGGMANLAAAIPFRAEFGGLQRWLIGSLRRLEVRVVTNHTVTEADVERERPDAVVIATGSIAPAPDIPGADGRAITVEEYVAARPEVGEHVVLVDNDGHFRGTATAEWLADQGKTVEYVTKHNTPGAELIGQSLLPQLDRLGKRTVNVHLTSAVSAIDGDRVTLTSLFNGATTTLDGIATVIVVDDREANDYLYRALEGRIEELYIAGDSLAPRRALEAMQDGHRVGRAI